MMEGRTFCAGRFGTLGVAIALAATVGAHGADESAPSFMASALLPASVLMGAHYQVAEKVMTEGYFHQFTITSDYGTFDAVGMSQLRVRTGEIRALAAIEEVSKTDVFLEAAGGAVVNVPDAALAHGSGWGFALLVLGFWLIVMFCGAVVSCVIRQALVKVTAKEGRGPGIKRLLPYLAMETLAISFAYLTASNVYNSWLQPTFWRIHFVNRQSAIIEWVLLLIFQVLCFVPNLLFRKKPDESIRSVWTRSNVLWALGFGLIYPMLLVFVRVFWAL
ncbi:MAG: hypothetical protein AB1714_17395 [Acidobacteriota bacterium]